MSSRIVACFSIALAAFSANLPRVDLHVHAHAEAGHAEMSMGEIAKKSAQMGVPFAIMAEGGCRGEIHDDATLLGFTASIGTLPLWKGLQVYGFEWPNCLSDKARQQLDFIAADALIFPYEGKNVLLWTNQVQFPDPEKFMDLYVEHNIRVLSQPIQVWANATYLPEGLQSQYDQLWTAARMDRVIKTAVKNGIAIEINSKYKIPSVAFIRRAKAAGAKFSFGSNSHVTGMGDIGECLRLANEAGLKRSQIYVPKRRLPPSAVERGVPVQSLLSRP